MITVEVVGEMAALFDPEFLKEAAAAVFHYFRDELSRESVTVTEFADALEKILRGFNGTVEVELGEHPGAARGAIRLAPAGRGLR